MGVLYVVAGYLFFAGVLALIGVLVVGKHLKNLPEEKTGYIERTDEEIISAWEEWLKRVPNPDEKILSLGLRLLSAREFVEALKNGDKEIRNLAIGASRTLAKHLGMDPVKEIIDQRP